MSDQFQDRVVHACKRKREDSAVEFGTALVNGTSHVFHDADVTSTKKMIKKIGKFEEYEKDVFDDCHGEEDILSQKKEAKKVEKDNITEEVRSSLLEEGISFEESAVTETVDVEENEEEEETALAELNAKKFFTSVSYTANEMSQIEPVLQAALEIPIEMVEQGGPDIYIEYAQGRDFRRNNQAEVELLRTQKALQDATITGDPREYQRIFFEIAKTKNTIINLGTGFGKTLIALLCIRHFSPGFKKGLQTLFLVPSVALAVQQTMTLRANLPSFTIRTACYVSSNSEAARLGLAEANVIVATHGAIQDLLMHYADLFRMNKFNLLVIDECHYATGNHAYAVIMKKFYHSTPIEERPRVLGLTASPLVNVKESHSDEQLQLMLGSLEAVLDSTLVSMSALGIAEDENISGILSKSAEERVIPYRGRPNIARSIPSADNLPLHQSRFREFRQLESLYQDLGPLVLALYVKTLARELSRNTYENESAYEFNRVIRHLNDIASFCDQECRTAPSGGRTDKLMALEELLEDQIEENGGAQTVGLVFVERRITALALHQYLLHRNAELVKGKWTRATKARHAQRSPFTLASANQSSVTHDKGSQFDDAMEDDPGHVFPSPSLMTQPVDQGWSISGVDHMDGKSNNVDDQFNDADDDVAISFIDASTTASTFTGSAGIAAGAGDFDDGQTIRFNPRRKNSVRSAVLVRNSTQIFKSLCLNRKCKEEEVERLKATWLHQETKIREVLDQLRRGQINILIATSVVEEGVDVQACSFVAVFDTLRNTKGYIQMKGRARQKDAKFFVFQDTNSIAGKSLLSLKAAQEMERRVGLFIEAQSRRSVAPLAMSPSSDLVEPEGEGVYKEVAALEAGGFTIECGLVDIQSAKSLLNRYTLSVPLDPFARSSKESLLAHMPVYGEDQLILPSHLPHDVRVIRLPGKYMLLPRREKHKMMALMACVRLHTLGLLNNRLLPLTRKDMQAHILRVATRELETVPLQHTPVDKAFSEIDTQLYVYQIQQNSATLRKYQTILGGKGHRLALVTLNPIGEIPDFKLRHSEFGLVLNSIGKESVATCSVRQRRVLSETFLLLMNERWRRRSRNMHFRLRSRDDLSGVVAPYYLGVTSSDGRLDWEFMDILLSESQRSMDERIEAVRRASTQAKLPEPRLWSPQYDDHVTYICFGPSGETCTAKFPHEKEGIDTYQDYFQKHRGFECPADSPLFEVQRLWNLPSNLPSNLPTVQDTDQIPEPPVKTEESRYEVCVELASVKLAQAACFEAPLANASIALLCSMLPQFLYFWEHCMVAKAFIEHSKRCIPTLGKYAETLPIEKVAIVLTTKSCCLDDSYDKLEWFGDAVLKLVQTDTLLKSLQLRQWIRFLHEGDLSTLRAAMGSNDRLEKTSKHLRLDNFIIATPLARGRWLPGHLDYTEGTEVKRADPLRGKVFADVIESILGLAYMEFGWTVTLKVADELQVTVPWDEIERERNQTSVKPELLDAVRDCAGYENFNYPELAEEAFTHPSALHPSVPSYQRLEWVGDAVLCLAAREWIYKHFLHLRLGDMVVMEAALVANETLAFLSIQNGLQQHLNHRDQSLPSRIETYDWSIRELGRGLWGADPPKTISDIVEAVLGAVHVDGGFFEGQKAVLQILDPVLGFLKKSDAEDRALSFKHPKKSMQEMGGELIELAAATESDFALSKDDALVWNGTQWGGADKEGSNYVSFVEFMGTSLLAISDSAALVARNRTCALMVAFLENHPDLLARLRTCRFNIESTMAKKAKVQQQEAALAKVDEDLGGTGM